MPELSIEKMKEILKAKNMTYDTLAEKTGMSKSSIAKIFGGFNENPTMKFLKSIANALECSMDDFFEWEEEPTSPYYLDRKTAKIAQEIFSNPEYRSLFDTLNDLTHAQIQAVISVANSIKDTNPNG